jgi:hypothetical protein
VAAAVGRDAGAARDAGRKLGGFGGSRRRRGAVVSCRRDRPGAWLLQPVIVSTTVRFGGDGSPVHDPRALVGLTPAEVEALRRVLRLGGPGPRS